MKPAVPETLTTRSEGIIVSDDVIIRTETQDSGTVFEDRMRVDFRNYVFREALDEGLKTRKDTISLAPTDNIDSAGRYIASKYKLNFSPDLVYGNACWESKLSVASTITSPCGNQCAIGVEL
jgi:hypothetical protein